MNHWRKAEKYDISPARTAFYLWTWNEQTDSGRSDQEAEVLLQITEKKVLQMLKTCTANSTHTCIFTLIYVVDSFHIFFTSFRLPLCSSLFQTLCSSGLGVASATYLTGH